MTLFSIFALRGRIHDYRICRIFQQSGLTCGSRLLSVVIIRHYL